MQFCVWKVVGGMVIIKVGNIDKWPIAVFSFQIFLFCFQLSVFCFLFSDICFAVCKVVGGVVIIKVGSINNRAISCTVHSADGSSYWKDRAPTLETTSLLCFISQPSSCWGGEGNSFCCPLIPHPCSLFPLLQSNK